MILEKTRPMRIAGQELHSAYLDQETGVRGYALSGPPRTWSRTTREWNPVVIFVVGALMVLLLDRLVNRPVTDLAEQVRKVAGGDYERPIASSGSPELRSLAGDVDGMRHRRVSRRVRVTTVLIWSKLFGMVPAAAVVAVRGLPAWHDPRLGLAVAAGLVGLPAMGPALPRHAGRFADRRRPRRRGRGPGAGGLEAPRR